MEQVAWKQLLDELSIYIDENYRILPFSEATVDRLPDMPSPTSVCAPCSIPSAYDDFEEDEPFCDIFKIFKDEPHPKLKEKSAAIHDINYILDAFEDTETFSEALLRIIKEKDLIEADVYNRVFMDRKLFNKIRNDRTYQPSKRTAILLSIALRLSVSETQELLEKAGFSLTHTSKTDIIIEFFMMRGNYNVIEINAALYEHRLPPLNK